MKFQIKADATFEADDVDDAMTQVVNHFLAVMDDDSGYETLEFEGTLTVRPFRDELGRHLYQKIKDAVKCSGTYDPDANMFYFEESLTSDEYNKCRAFLAWCHATGTTFGHGNYEAVYQRFVEVTK